jgi:hypothetical protein
MFKNQVATTKGRHFIFPNINKLMLFSKIIAAYTETLKKPFLC